jgi:hypothetical protein
MKRPLKPILEKAEELIRDFIDMQPNGLKKWNVEMMQQYKFAKLQAQYCCHVAKWSHPEDSIEFQYWEDIKQVIEEL